MSDDPSMSHFAREMETGAARTLGCITAVFLLLVGGCLFTFVVENAHHIHGPTPSFEPEPWERPVPNQPIQRQADPDPPLPEFPPKSDAAEPKKARPRAPVVISPRDGKAAKIP
jgi:hypothetical protein